MDSSISLKKTAYGHVRNQDGTVTTSEDARRAARIIFPDKEAARAFDAVMQQQPALSEVRTFKVSKWANVLIVYSYDAFVRSISASVTS